jgi:hypothetical protein
MPTIPNSPLSALGGRVAEKRLSHLVVAELSRCVVQHRLVIDTFLGERGMVSSPRRVLCSRHEEEQPKNTQKFALPSMPMSSSLNKDIIRDTL